MQGYHLTKSLGLLKIARPAARIGASDKEDETLAEWGLDSYADPLLEDDRP